MVEVDFTKNKELYDYFKKVWKSGGTITIAGINSLGNEFETTGRIATDFLDNISVYESFIYLNFGKWWRRDWIAPYRKPSKIKTEAKLFTFTFSLL